MKKVKSLITLAMVLMMLLSANIPAFAASKPTAQLQCGYTQTVRRGRSAKFVFNLRSGSYTRKNGLWRSRFNLYILRNPNNANSCVAYDAGYFTGNVRLTERWNVPCRLATGRYTLLYGTFYRANGRSNWSVSSAKRASIRVI